MQGERNETQRSPEQVADILARLEAWLETDAAWALEQADVVQLEIHVKGSSIRPKVSAVRQTAI